MTRSISKARTLSLWFPVLLLSLVLLSTSNAQITIPPSGFSNLLTAGTSFYMYQSDSLPKTVNIGKKGGPNVFDLNGYTFQTTNLANVHSVGSIPTLAARYPAKAVTIGGSPQQIENSPVFLLGTDTMFVIGEASLTPLRKFRHIRPYEVMAVFPVTYGVSRTYTHMHYDTTYLASGSVLSVNSFSGSDSVSVDGYGTLKVLGRQFECLRVRSNHYTFSDKEFMFMTREGVFLDITTLSTQKDTGVVQPESVMLLVPSSLVGVEQPESLPSDYTLEQNYPNPFNPSTTISYQLSTVSLVNLKVFNVLGEVVATLVNEVQPAGTHAVRLNAGSLTSGIYFYQLQAGEYLGTKKMILLK
jgi:hypothetical protein